VAWFTFFALENFIPCSSLASLKRVEVDERVSCHGFSSFFLGTFFNHVATFSLTSTALNCSREGLFSDPPVNSVCGESADDAITERNLG
jgi:hypothetical protein